jgi:hypothetical protein
MQSLPYAVVSRVPFQAMAGCGARQRNAPTGGAANGMPFQLMTPWSMAPLILPVSMTTTGAAAVALEATNADTSIAAAAVRPLRLIWNCIEVIS